MGACVCACEGVEPSAVGVEDDRLFPGADAAVDALQHAGVDHLVHEQASAGVHRLLLRGTTRGGGAIQTPAIRSKRILKGNSRPWSALSSRGVWRCGAARWRSAASES